MSSAAKLTLKFMKLSEHGFQPIKGTPLSAGFDLHSAYDYSVPSKEKQLVKTDIAIEVPEGYYGRIAPRSGLAVKKFIDIGAGVIDRDYRGNVGVVLFNFGSDSFEIKKGDKIAQLILVKIADIDKCEEVESLDETERGAAGFGSTGVCGDNTKIESNGTQEPDAKKLKSDVPAAEA